MTRAANLPNLTRLLGVVTDYQHDVDNDQNLDNMQRRNNEKYHQYMPAMVMEHAGAQARWFCHGVGKEAHSVSGRKYDDEQNYLSIYEIKYFLYHLLIALDSLHSQGIMHRDVKPRNVLITRNGNSSSQIPYGKLLLIDLGLADFYLPGTRYNVRVASRHYKAPELLVGDKLYDYAVDLWGVGCILAGLLFRREPFFRGRDNVDQLAKIASVLGNSDLISFYCHKRRIRLTPDVERALLGPSSSSSELLLSIPQKRRSWIPFIPKGITYDKNYREGLDLLDNLLVYDHERRFTARETMAHVFFDEVRGRVENEMFEKSGSERHNLKN